MILLKGEKEDLDIRVNRYYFGIIFLFFFFTFSINSLAQKSKNVSSFVPVKLSQNLQIKFDSLYIDAITNKMLNEYGKAYSSMSEAFLIDSTNPALNYELGEYYAVRLNMPKAEEYAKKAIFYNPDNNWYKIFLANIYRQTSNLEGQAEVYKLLLEANPKKDDYYMLSSACYKSMEKYDESLNIIEKYESVFGVSDLSLYEKANIYIIQKNDTKAIQTINTLSSKFPNSTKLIKELTDSYFGSNISESKVKILEKSSKSYANTGLANKYLADYYFNKGDEVNFNLNAIKAFSSPTWSKNDKIEYFNSLLIIADTTYEDKRRLTKYLDILDKKYSDDSDVLLLRVSLLEKFDDKKEKFLYLLSLVDGDTIHYSIWDKFLLSAQEQNKTEILFEYSNKAVKYFPKEPLPYMFVSLFYLEEKNYSKAKPYLIKGSSLSTENAYLRALFYSFLGESMYRTDSIEQAFEYFDKCILLNPNDAQTLNNYAYYLCLLNRNLEKAENMSYSAVMLEPNTKTYIDTYAWVLYKRSNYSLAKFFMKRIFEGEKSDISYTYYDHYGDILYKNDEKEEAILMWKSALECEDIDSKSIDDINNKLTNGI